MLRRLSNDFNEPTSKALTRQSFMFHRATVSISKRPQWLHRQSLSQPAEIKELQEIVGVFLFYSRAVDPTMLTAINKIASRQAKPTSLIKKEVERFLQYANKWPNATMRIRASDMKLVCHSDGSYLSESDARSRAGGILFLGDW